jgi:hypothetical protein
MGCPPKRGRNLQRVDPVLPPAAALVAAVAVMNPADRNSEPVTHVAPHGMRLRDFDVMGVARGSAADQAGLSDDKFQMRAVALASVFGLRSPSLRRCRTVCIGPHREPWPRSRRRAGPGWSS